MTGTKFAQYVRKQSGTNTDTLSDSDLLLFANVEKDDLAETITENVSEDYFMISLDRNLVADKREYALPNEILLHMKRFSAKLDGDEWSLLEQRDASQIRKPLVTEENITTAYAGRKPEFDILDRGIKIYSENAIIEVANGIHIDAMVYPSDIESAQLASGADLSIPTSQVTTALPKATHKVWALRTSIAYKQSRPKTIPLTAEETNIEVYVQRMLNKLKGRNLDRTFVPNEPYNDGTEY